MNISEAIWKSPTVQLFVIVIVYLVRIYVYGYNIENDMEGEFVS